MDKIKNFCDQSMILWEMKGILLTDAWIPPPPPKPPASFRVNRPKSPHRLGLNVDRSFTCIIGDNQIVSYSNTWCLQN